MMKSIIYSNQTNTIHNQHVYVLYTVLMSVVLSTLFYGQAVFANNLPVKKVKNKQCQQQYMDGVAPVVKQRQLLVTQLCKQGFVIGYSHTTRTPLWSAEYLTIKRLKKADKLKRKASFYSETSLPASSRVSIKHFKKKGYDRGHLAPSHDMPTMQAQIDSFSLANIALQHRRHNRSVWSKIERLTRHQVYQYNDAYVVTGLAFLTKRKTRYGIPIASHFFKAVYIPALNEAGVYWSKNDGSGHLQIISLAQLRQKVGLDVMPSLPNRVKKQASPLALDTRQPKRPTHKNNSYPNKPNNKDPENIDDAFESILTTFFEELLNMLAGLFK